MKKKRIKAATIADKAEFLRAVNTIAMADNTIRLAETQRDAAIQATRDEWDKVIEQQTQLRNGLALIAEKYATAHRAEVLPGPTKSAETVQATYGFRTGMPTLKTLSKWTWKKVLAKIREVFPGGEYVRTKPEVDKARIIADITANGELGSQTPLGAIGCRLVQTEAFFVEPKDQPTK